MRNEQDVRLTVWCLYHITVPSSEADMTTNSCEKTRSATKRLWRSAESSSIPFRLCPWEALSSWLDLDLLLSTDGLESSFSVTIKKKTVKYVQNNLRCSLGFACESSNCSLLSGLVLKYRKLQQKQQCSRWPYFWVKTSFPINNWSNGSKGICFVHLSSTRCAPSSAWCR